MPARYRALVRFQWRDLARWLVAEMEREQGRAGPEAMRALGASFNLDATV